MYDIVSFFFFLPQIHSAAIRKSGSLYKIKLQRKVPINHVNQ